VSEDSERAIYVTTSISTYT